MSPDRSPSTNAPISRRTALRAGAAASAAGVGMTVAAPVPCVPPRTPRDATEHLEVVFIPADPVTITLAGGGPPQRGDYFYIDGPIYAVDDVNGTQIGMYHCFGAWTTAADDTDAPYQRLTTVQFLLDEGSIMGLINELGTEPDLYCRGGARGNRTLYGCPGHLPTACRAGKTRRNGGDASPRHARSRAERGAGGLRAHAAAGQLGGDRWRTPVPAGCSRRVNAQTRRGRGRGARGGTRRSPGSEPRRRRRN